MIHVLRIMLSYERLLQLWRVWSQGVGGAGAGRGYEVYDFVILQLLVSSHVVVFISSLWSKHGSAACDAMIYGREIRVLDFFYSEDASSLQLYLGIILSDFYFASCFSQS